MVSFRIDTKLLDRINGLKESKTDVIHKALDLYLQSSESVNTAPKENVNTKRNTTVNTSHKESVNTVNHVNHEIQVTENYELLGYLKRDNEWLRDRVEHLEKTQDIIFEKIDNKPEKERHELSWYRM